MREREALRAESALRLAQEAARQNEAKRQADSAQSMLARMQQQQQRSSSAPAATGQRVTELSPAEAEKESGNAAFKAGNYEQVYIIIGSQSADLPSPIHLPFERHP